jgi:hypothetical protein
MRLDGSARELDLAVALDECLVPVALGVSDSLMDHPPAQRLIALRWRELEAKRPTSGTNTIVAELVEQHDTVPASARSKPTTEPAAIEPSLLSIRFDRE